MLKIAYFSIIAVLAIVIAENGNDGIYKRRQRRDTHIAITQKISIVQQQLTSIQFKSPDYGKQLSASLEPIKGQIKAIDTDRQLTALLGSIGVFSSNIEKLASGNPADITVGLMNSVAAFTPFAGPAGVALSGVLSVITGIIGNINKGPSMTEIIEKMINTAIANLHMEGLEEEVKGAKDWIVNSQNYMRPQVNKVSITDAVMQGILTNVPTYQAVTSLGKVSKHLERLSTDHKSGTSGESAIILARLYAELSNMREAMLITLHSLPSKAGPDHKGTEESILSVIQGSREQSKEVLKFLRQPELKNAQVAIRYNAGSELAIEKRLEISEGPAALDDVQAGCYYIKSNGYSHAWYLYDDVVNQLRTYKGSPYGDYKFRFHAVRQFWAIESRVKPGWFWSVRRWFDNHCAVGGGRLGSCRYEREYEPHVHITPTNNNPDYRLFKIVKFVGGEYFIGPKSLPGHPLRFGGFQAINTWNINFDTALDEANGNHFWRLERQTC